MNVFLDMKNLLGDLDNLFAFLLERKATYFQLIWCFSCVLLVILCLIESFLNKIYGTKLIDETILLKILLSIETCSTIDTLQLLQEYPQYINCPAGEFQYTPFLLSCYHGNTHLVKYMLRMNADLKTKTRRGETPFYLAVANLINKPLSVDASCIRELFYAGCDVNAPNVSGCTPLHLAAYFGHKPLTKWLLEKGADKNVHPSPAVVASIKGYLEVAHLISNWDDRRRRMITSE
ncbi:hypothetical protein HHI36_019799 [Cryptolaemus montrouzieri]|uniref:Uncharacterized protein n=1 Tax=Cryptolaemus montrouzieri TaxID=559131 RepID=A0ABD2N8R4_9CUCU